MKKINKYYLVYFDSFGYYSLKQPNYEWSFSNDIEFALKYKTLKGAISRIDHSQELNDKKYGNLNNITIEILEEKILINGNNKQLTYNVIQTLKKDDIIYYLKNEKEKKYSKKYSKKYPIINSEPIKKEILNISADDPYWD